MSFAKAICCSDHVHCCPKGYRCDVQAGTCTQAMSSLPWFTKLSSTQVKSSVFSVKCPDGRATCSDNTTCCELPHGGHGCCPVPQVIMLLHTDAVVILKCDEKIRDMRSIINAY